MVDAIGCRDRLILLRQHTFKASQIDTGFIRVTAPLVMGVDTADPAEIVFCRSGAPCVAGQVVSPAQHPNGFCERCDGGGTPATAE